MKIWQNRELGEYAPAWDPGTRHSPNTLFAAAMSQGGFALQIPSPELYYELLPVHLVKIHGRRGVKIRGLWYDGPALDPYRSGPSPQGGAARGKWKIRREPRDCRYVFFCDPRTHEWHDLRWTCLPPEGEVPSFSDIRADDLLRAARAAGLQPRSDADLLPLLLDLTGGLMPVDTWPTQMSRQQRTAHARESAQAGQAAADRPAPAAAVPSAGTTTAQPRQDRAVGTDATVVPLHWRDQARDASAAPDAAAVSWLPEPHPSRPADEGRPAPRQHAPRPGPGPRADIRTRRASPTRGSRDTHPGRRAGGKRRRRSCPFVLPGPPPMRETLTGWQQWRTTRGSFTPAPQPDRAGWQALPPRPRMLYDLHRAATHASLPLQQTPMSQAVAKLLRGRIESNALKHKPSTDGVLKAVTWARGPGPAAGHLVQRPPRRRHRGNRTEQLTLIAHHARVADRLAAVGDRAG